MKRISVLLTVALTFLMSHLSYCQGLIKYETVARSELRDYSGNRYGTGDLEKVSFTYNFALAKNWRANVYADYANMDNRGEAAEINDDKIINLGITFSHLRPLSEKWDMLISAGGGIFSPLVGVSFRCMLGNGGLGFVCHINDNFDLGGGLALTNAYGIPMLMPTLYLGWHRDGRFRFNISMADPLSVKASTRFGKMFELDLYAVEMSGISAVRRNSKIYSQLMVRSYITPTLRLNESTCFFANIGGNWARSVCETDRSLKAFFKAFGEEHKSKDFRPALMLAGGVKWRF